MSIRPWLDSSLPIYTPYPLNPNHTLNQGRVAWWKVLPGLGGGKYLYDLVRTNHSALGNTGSGASGTSWSNLASPGGYGSLNTDGVNDFLDAPSPLSGVITQATIGAWVYRASATDFAIIGWSDLYQHRFDYIWFSNDNVYFQIGDGTDIFPAAFLSGTGWHRILLVYNGAWTNRLVAYIDGTDRGIGATSATTSYTVTGTFKAQVETGHGSPSQFSTARWGRGNVDDITVWNRALTASEARADYELSRNGYPGVLNRYRPTNSPFSASAPSTGKVPWHLFFGRVA